MDAGTRDLNTLDDDTFRQEVRQFLRDNYPDEIRNPPRRLHWRRVQALVHDARREGLALPGWPKEHGGIGLSAGKQIVLIEEYERHGCAHVRDMGMIMLGPLLIRYGTEEQKRPLPAEDPHRRARLVPGLLRAQRRLRPRALRTEAVLDGDHCVVNGQKIWTTLGDGRELDLPAGAHRQAGQEAGRHQLPAGGHGQPPGITVRPIVNLELHDEFCEVFFDNVRVPKENLVGQPNKGWDHGQGAARLRAHRISARRGSPSYALGAAQAAGRAHGRVGARPLFRTSTPAAPRSRGSQVALRDLRRTCYAAASRSAPTSRC